MRVRQSIHRGNRESDVRQDKRTRYRYTALMQTSAVSEQANEMGHLPIWKEIKFIDCNPHWYTRRVKEAIHIRLHPNNINRDSGIEIPEARILRSESTTADQPQSRPVREQHRIVQIIMRIEMHQ